MKRSILIFAIYIGAFYSSASATVIHVPGDYPTIQEGIDACMENDTVMVADGIYFENIVINKRMSLIGESRDGVIIDGSDTGDVIFVDTLDVYVSSLAVRNSGVGYYDSGIELSFANNCTIDYCRFDSNYSGLLLIGSSYNIISRCVFFLNDNAIRFFESDSEPTPNNQGNIIRNNIIENSASFGILLEHTGEPHHLSNLVVGNRISSNDMGISSIMAQDNIFAYNDIVVNSGYGIFHSMCLGGGDNNQFHQNNFISNNDNSVQAADYGGGIDFWFSPDNERGNYWSDYTGPDQNGDGIGDIPYAIDGNESFDQFPLMEPLFATISGVVGDGLEPVEDVFVEVIGTDFFDFTGPYGGFSFDSLGAGIYDIFFGHPAFRETTVVAVPTTLDQVTNIAVTLDYQTEIDGKESIKPVNFIFFQNYPNPFNAQTTIEYDLPWDAFVTVEIFDILGGKVATLFNEKQTAGYYQIEWKAIGKSSGIYFCRFQSGKYGETRRLVLLK
ncbi:MAG: NosD domain-containing protein [candidate division Zixibacteria bacterium]